MKKTYSTPLTGVYTVKAECLLGTSSGNSLNGLNNDGGDFEFQFGDNEEEEDASGAF